MPPPTLRPHTLTDLLSLSNSLFVFLRESTFSNISSAHNELVATPTHTQAPTHTHTPTHTHRHTHTHTHTHPHTGTHRRCKVVQTSVGLARAENNYSGPPMILHSTRCSLLTYLFSLLSSQSGELDLLRPNITQPTGKVNT